MENEKPTKGVERDRRLQKQLALVLLGIALGVVLFSVVAELCRP